MIFPARLSVALGLLLSVMIQGAAAQTEGDSDKKIAVVILSALDKITTQLSTIEIRQDQTVRFGTLAITLRYCRANPPEETPENTAFLEITDRGHDNEEKKVFSGWMFSSSPALSPLEHPVYDVWVRECKMVSAAEFTPRQ